MFEKLAGIESRYDELEQLMADPEVAQDYVAVAAYAQERSELEELVETYRTYVALEEELAGARAILGEAGDDELYEMAQEEEKRLQAQIERYAARLRRMLLPKDPRDERNVIIEIRAGAGGDEAGLFAAVLHRMYYALRRGTALENRAAERK